MLEDPSLEQALLTTAAATVVVCTAMGMWIPSRKFRTWFPVVMIGCAGGAAVVGKANGHPVNSMLVLWSFTLIGLAAGMFPLRELLAMSVRDASRGVVREYRLPRWRLTFCIIVTCLAAFAGAVLTTPK